MNIFIVEDDTIQINGLKHIIEDAYDDPHVFTASTYDQALSVIDSHNNIDLFLLDINLGTGKTGLDVCSYIRTSKIYDQAPVIFITDITVPNLDVINKYHCSYYFSKPYDRNDVLSAINKVMHPASENKYKIKLRDIQGIYFHIIPDSIMYVCASGHHKHLFTDCGDFIVTNSVFDTLLDNEHASIIRCHKGYYINPSFVKSYDKSNSILHLNGADTVIPVGRKYKTAIEQGLEDIKC